MAIFTNAYKNINGWTMIEDVVEKRCYNTELMALQPTAEFRTEIRLLFRTKIHIEYAQNKWHVGE